jgi:hypothetical protein
LTFICPCIASSYISKVQPTRCNVFSIFISINCSTCFRRFVRPSSGAQNCYLLLSWMRWNCVPSHPRYILLVVLQRCSNYVTAETTDGSGFDSIQKQRLCSFFKAPGPALGPKKTYYPVVTEASSTGIKQCGREPDHSSVSGAEINNTSKYNCTPPHVFTHFLGQITDLLLVRIAFSLLVFCKNTTQRFNRRTLDMKHRVQHNILISAFVNRVIMWLITKTNYR